MNPAAPTIEALVERLAAVERTNRSRHHLGTAGLVVGATAIALAIAALVSRSSTEEHRQHTVEKVVEAERFVVRDALGAVRAELAIEGGREASLKFFGRHGVQRLRLRPSGVYVSDPSGTQRAALHLVRGTHASDPSAAVLHLADASGQPHGSLIVSADGSSRLSLSDRDGSSGASLRAETPGSAGLAISGPLGREAAWLGTLPDGSRTLVLTGSPNRAKAMLSIADDGASELLLADRAGKERAALALLPDGAPLFNLFDGGMRGGATLALTPSGSPVLDLVDSDGKAGATLAAARGSAGVMIRNAAGKTVAELTTEAGRWPRLLLSGDGANISTLLTASPGGAPGLALYDRFGRPRLALGQISTAKETMTREAADRVPFSLSFVDRNGKIVRRIPP